jgi:hypothetical protein
MIVIDNDDEYDFDDLTKMVVMVITMMFNDDNFVDVDDGDGNGNGDDDGCGGNCIFIFVQCGFLHRLLIFIIMLTMVIFMIIYIR